MISLSVNVNKIATLRNSRGGDIPNLLTFTKVIMDSGAHGITVHPRSDERHITRKDTKDLKKYIIEYNKEYSKKIEYNIEGAPDERFLDIVLENLPDQATLVPVRPGEVTSDHGFDLKKEGESLYPLIQKIRSAGVRVSLFLDTSVDNMNYAKQIDADRIEFYTGPFAEAFDSGNGMDSFLSYEKAALAATKLGIGVNAGHDLDEKNLAIFKKLSGLREVSIGHRLMSFALLNGMENAVKTYLKALNG
ncbi:MAG: pyridoxine 5'-phosphate synthase [Leptospiraceae bacterium]|nr:pyridoxine 5'-phosphate synthase [Leptospiraceae bacterium]